METITEIKWTQYPSDEYEDEYHTVPVLKGKIMKPHTLSEECPCHPDIDLYMDGCVYTHNVIH